MAFGAGCLSAAAECITAQAPGAVLIVTSPQVTHLADPLVAALRAQGITVGIWDEIAKEPHVDDLARGLAAARDIRAGLIVGLGGGSAMDVAKQIAA